MDSYVPCDTLRAYKANHKLILKLTEEFIEKFNAPFPDSAPVADVELQRKLTDIHWNLYYYLMHHCRHLGMMEALKGLLNGKGSASA